MIIRNLKLVRLYDIMGHKQFGFQTSRIYKQNNDSDEIAPAGMYLRQVGEPPLADIYIYIAKKHYSTNQGFATWTLFGHLKLCDKESRAFSWEEHSKLETCPLEEKASPHKERLPRKQGNASI